MALNSPEPPYRQTLREVAADLAGQRELLLKVHGTMALRLGDTVNPVALQGVAFAPIPGIAGMSWALLPAPIAAAHSHLVVRGESGAQSPRVSIPHYTRIHVMRGALLWWQASVEGRRRVEAGEILELAPNEEHGLVVLEDYSSYNIFTPPL